MMTHYLAEVAGGNAGPDVMKILAWGSTFVLAVLAATVKPLMDMFKKRWQAEAIKDAHVTVKSPVPTIHTKEEVELVTKPDLDERLGEIRNDIEEIKDAIEKDRAVAREERTKASDTARDSLGKIHKRIDEQSIATSTIRGEVKVIGENVSQLLNIALQGKTPPRR